MPKLHENNLILYVEEIDYLYGQFDYLYDYLYSFNQKNFNSCCMSGTIPGAGNIKIKWHLSHQFAY